SWRPMAVGSSSPTSSPGIPTVTFGEPLDLPESDSVQGDDTAGAFLTIDHLLSLGIRDVLFLDGPTGRQERSRRQGCAQARRAAGLALRTRPSDGPHVLLARGRGRRRFVRITLWPGHSRAQPGHASTSDDTWSL